MSLQLNELSLVELHHLPYVDHLIKILCLEITPDYDSHSRSLKRAPQLKLANVGISISRVSYTRLPCV